MKNKVKCVWFLNLTRRRVSVWNQAQVSAECDSAGTPTTSENQVAVFAWHKFSFSHLLGTWFSPGRTFAAFLIYLTLVTYPLWRDGSAFWLTRDDSYLEHLRSYPSFSKTQLWSHLFDRGLSPGEGGEGLAAGCSPNFSSSAVKKMCACFWQKVSASHRQLLWPLLIPTSTWLVVAIMRQIGLKGNADASLTACWEFFLPFSTVKHPSFPGLPLRI